MSYNSIAQAAQDSALRLRVAACIAQESSGPDQPEALASLHMWRIVAEPGWGDAYETDGVAGITDQMILAAVQKFVPILEFVPNAVQTLNELDETVSVLAAEILGA